MKDKFFILFILVSCQLAGQKINGLSFVASGDSLLTSKLDPVLKTNANFVALMPFGFMKNLSEPKIRFNESKQWFGERAEGVRQYASKFRK